MTHARPSHTSCKGSSVGSMALRVNGLTSSRTAAHLSAAPLQTGWQRSSVNRPQWHEPCSTLETESQASTDLLRNHA